MTIRELLEKYDVTMMDVSKMYGIPYRTLQGWKAEERKPPQWVINLLEIALENRTEI